MKFNSPTVALEGFEPPQDVNPLSVFKTDPFSRTWVFLHNIWCPRSDLNRYELLHSQDFKSCASTYSATEAQNKWCLAGDSNPRYAFGVYTISNRAPSASSDNSPYTAGAKCVRLFTFNPRPGSKRRTDSAFPQTYPWTAAWGWGWDNGR